MFLSVIRPPNNAETALMKLKHEFYSQTGLVSSWALKPVVPVAVFSDFSISLSRKELPLLPDEGLALSEFAVTDEQLCLGSPACTDFCRQLSTLFRECHDYAEGLCGLQLFDTSEPVVEERAVLIEKMKKLAGELEAPAVKWRTCSLAVLQTETKLFGGQCWWKRVDFETVLEIRFPKSFRQS